MFGPWKLWRKAARVMFGPWKLRRKSARVMFGPWKLRRKSARVMFGPWKLWRESKHDAFGAAFPPPQKELRGFLVMRGVPVLIALLGCSARGWGGRSAVGASGWRAQRAKRTRLASRFIAGHSFSCHGPWRGRVGKSRIPCTVAKRTAICETQGVCDCR